jgi:cytochrome c peroxidase
MNKAGIFLWSIALAVVSCNKEDKPAPQPFGLEVPVNFPAIPANPDNPLTREGVELGRRLFYDKRLSGTNQVSCGSCHKQELAFADGVALTDKGVSGRLLHRNSPALINMAWATNGLFWDGGSTNLESQAFAPITHKDEMHQELFQLVNELKAIPDYVARFRAAFNSDITDAAVVKALAQFQRTFISANSRYDKFKRQESGGVLSNTEQIGLQLVNEKCRTCHTGELFTDNNYHNNGIDDDFSNTADEGIYQGRYRITFSIADLGKFKTPTLRNILLTAPYMHDGRFSSIEQVLDHYSNGIKTSATLDPLLPASGGFQFSTADKQAIIAYLKTLTDSVFINNKQLSTP